MSLSMREENRHGSKSRPSSPVPIRHSLASSRPNPSFNPTPNPLWAPHPPHHLLITKIPTPSPLRVLFLFLFPCFPAFSYFVEHLACASASARGWREGPCALGGMGRVVLGLAVGCAVVACGIAAVAVGRRVKSRRSWARAVAVVTDLEEGCATPYSRLRQVVDAMAVEMHAGLASDGGSKLKMLLTFVDALPDGYFASLTTL